MKSFQILMMGGDDTRTGYGYLYNYYAFSDANFAPTDWKVPETSDYSTLATYLSTNPGDKLKVSGTTYWTTATNNGTNSAGWNGIGHGRRYDVDGAFQYEGFYARYATTTLPTAYQYRCYNLTSNLSTFTLISDYFATGNAVRLIYTGAGTPSSLTDYDGNVYDVVLIGTQYWLAENWKCTSLNEGTSMTNVTSDATWIAAGVGDKYYCAFDNNEDKV